MGIVDTIRTKYVILAAILILCKLEGEDVKIIFGIRHFWIQHTQIDSKSHGYHFFPDLHLRCLYIRKGPSLSLRDWFMINIYLYKVTIKRNTFKLIKFHYNVLI